MADFDSRALPEFKRWHQHWDFKPDLLSYIQSEVSITSTILISELMFPDLVIVRDCLLLSMKYDSSNFEEWWEKTGGEPQSVEGVLNHVHMWDLFDPVDEIEERGLEALAHRIAQSWKLHAEHEFPNRAITVDVTDDYGPTITLTSTVRGRSHQ